MTWDAIVFDLDGTLVDSGVSVVASARAAFVAQGLEPPSGAAVRQQVGRPLATMLADLGPPHADVDRLVAVYRAHYIANAPKLERLFPGTVDLLVELHEGDVPTAVATGKSQDGAEHAVARHELGWLMRSVHGIVPGTPGKPDPAVLLRALAALGGPRRPVVVGDTTWDVRMARAIGVDVIGVSWGMHTPDVLRDAGAIDVVDSVGALRDRLLLDLDGSRTLGA